MKLSEAMGERMLLSFELFPPKTEKGMDNLPGTIDHLMKYKPAYISCTYGAAAETLVLTEKYADDQESRNNTGYPFHSNQEHKRGNQRAAGSVPCRGCRSYACTSLEIFRLVRQQPAVISTIATDLVKFVRDEIW